MTPGLTSADGDVASVSAEWLNDTRDSPIYPTSGYYYRGVIEPGWVNQQDGSNGIIRGQVEGRRFKMFGKLNPDCPPKRPPAVLALRVQAGAYAGTLPFFEQFFLGGTHGLRGYLEDRFWGPYLVQATAEYRYPLSRSIAAVAFIDAGDAWGSRWQFVPGTDTDFEQHEGFEPRAGIGVGGRYVGPLGALGLDFAWGEQFLVTLVFGQTF
jgi:outer membrane protein insertion porin family